MGLDSVELVMAFEEVFQISIADLEAEKMRTPRDVIECIVAQLDARTSGPAVLRDKKDAAWTRLSQASVIAGLLQDGVTRDHALDQVFADRSSRREQWRRLKDELHARAWPRLRWLGLSSDFPPQLKTLGDLADWISRHNMQQLTAEERQNLTHGDIALLVKDIVLEQLGLPEEKYGEDKRFIEDMGLD